MNIWHIPAVRTAAEIVLLEWRAVRRERPNWSPMAGLREAKRRHVDEILTAVTAITMAEELAANGHWRSMAVHRPSTHRPCNYLNDKRAAAQERYARIRAIAAEHPDWSITQIAECADCGRTTVSTALRSDLKTPSRAQHPSSESCSPDAVTGSSQAL